MAELGRKTKRYPSDLMDEEWARIEPLLAKPLRRGRKPEVDLREVLNATRNMARRAGGWPQPQQCPKRGHCSACDPNRRKNKTLAPPSGVP
jgi:transposase